MGIFSIKNELMKTIIAFPSNDKDAINVAKKLIEYSNLSTLYLYKGVCLLAQIR